MHFTLDLLTEMGNGGSTAKLLIVTGQEGNVEKSIEIQLPVAKRDDAFKKVREMLITGGSVASVSLIQEKGEFIPCESNALALINLMRQTESNPDADYSINFTALKHSMLDKVGWGTQTPGKDEPFGNQLAVQMLKLRLSFGCIGGALTRLDSARVFAAHMLLLMETFNVRFGELVFVGDSCHSLHQEVLNKILTTRKL